MTSARTTLHGVTGPPGGLWSSPHAKSYQPNSAISDPVRPAEQAATSIIGPCNLRGWEMKLTGGERSDGSEDPPFVTSVLNEYVDTEATDVWRSAGYRFHAVVADRRQR